MAQNPNYANPYQNPYLPTGYRYNPSTGTHTQGGTTPSPAQPSQPTTTQQDPNAYRPGYTEAPRSETLYSQRSGELRGPTATSQWGDKWGGYMDPSRRTGASGVAGQMQRAASNVGGGSSVYAEMGRQRGALQAPSAPGAVAGQVSNLGTRGYSADAMQQAMGTSADLGDAYDNAFRQAAERINSQAAATGMLGSSSTGDLVREAAVDLAARQAMDEAQYGLDRGALIAQTAGAADEAAAMGDENLVNALSNMDRNQLEAAGLGMEGAQIGLEAAARAAGLDQAADVAGLEGLQGAGNLFLGEEEATLNRARTDLDADRAEDASALSQIMGEATLAENADQRNYMITESLLDEARAGSEMAMMVLGIIQRTGMEADKAMNVVLQLQNQIGANRVGDAADAGNTMSNAFASIQ